MSIARPQAQVEQLPHGAVYIGRLLTIVIMQAPQVHFALEPFIALCQGLLLKRLH